MARPNRSLAREERIEAMTRKLFAAALAGFLFSGVTMASAFPDRPVRIVVPFAAGGVTDLAARMVGQQLSAKWGQPVVIENRPGAGGLLGVEAVIKSPPDGYTILMGTNGEFVIHQAASQRPRFSMTDVIPITMVTVTFYAIAANDNSGVGTLQGLVQQAKAKPGTLSYSSAGVGSTMHMASEQFAAAAGIKLLHVPYRGGAPAATAVTSGEVSIGFTPLSSLGPVKDSGRAKLLAVTSKKRLAMLPDVPTVEETGVLKGFEAAVWTGLFAPKGTPDAIVSKIRTDALEALKDKGLVEKLTAAGAEPTAIAGEELAALIKKETDELSKVAKAANITLE
jgi:tripartite-type tricarboxylate transporter receptor subunit TctC